MAQADVVALLTEWEEFRHADPDYLAGFVRQRLIVDGRHALDASDYTAKGWEYRALGRPYQARTVPLAGGRARRRHRQSSLSHAVSAGGPGQGVHGMLASPRPAAARLAPDGVAQALGLDPDFVARHVRPARCCRQRRCPGPSRPGRCGPAGRRAWWLTRNCRSRCSRCP